MKRKFITLRWLKKMNACEDELQTFRRRFPTGKAEATKENMRKTATWQLVWLWESLCAKDRECLPWCTACFPGLTDTQRNRRFRRNFAKAAGLE